MSFRGNNFNDRMADQKKAKLDLLKRAQEKQMSPEVKAKLAAERIEVARAPRHPPSREREETASSKLCKTRRQKCKKKKIKLPMRPN